MKTILSLLLSLSLGYAQEPDLSKLFNLEGVSNVQVEADGIKVTHSSGVKRIPINKLSPELIEHYKLNSDESKLARQQAVENQQKLADANKQIEIEKNAKVSYFKVSQNLDDGLVVYRMYVLNGLHEAKTPSFITHNAQTRGLTDGKTFTAKVMKNGIRKLTLVTGAVATVESYQILGEISNDVGTFLLQDSVGTKKKK